MLRHPARFAALAVLTLTLAACSAGDLDDFRMGPIAPAGASVAGTAPGSFPIAAGESIGTGPVRVALLLPLSGDPGLVQVGLSMANGARLAMAYIAEKPDIADNITLIIKDSGTTPQSAAQAALLAAGEGASLILGPLKADQVAAAAAVARASGLTLIGFSNNSTVAAPGVFLLNVLPATEMRRSLGFAKAQGRQGFAGLFPATEFGRLHQAGFEASAAQLGLRVTASLGFSSIDEARAKIAELAPLILSGQVDTLLLPDRATAGSFAVLLADAGILPGRVTIIGSADWQGDTNLSGNPYFAGAWFPGVDDAGYTALAPLYTARFGGVPHPLVTIAYTATILANTSILALTTPRYDRARLTATGGYVGRDGAFRFLPDGKSDYALAIKQIVAGGSIRVLEPARL
ncbi:MAG: transporter substrate-binding protein [Devosia sp.]|nr:transporter substrate-binding protein [Devosia sp.]